MSAAVAYDDVEVGTGLPPQTFAVTRADLVRYAGSSGDFNVIHWNERVARAVGLPDVIAHGMLTMAEAARVVVTDWAGDPGRVESYGVRFSRPVVVPDDDAGQDPRAMRPVDLAARRLRQEAERRKAAPAPASGGGSAEARPVTVWAPDALAALGIPLVLLLAVLVLG